jgi:hypothetical protein
LPEFRKTGEEDLMRGRIICGLALMATLIVGVCVAGCGSSSSSTSTETTAAISKAEFVSKGNAVCVKGEKAQEAEINAYIKKHGLENKKPSKAQEAELAETVLVPNIQSQINGVKALGAPSGEEQQVSSALELSQQTLEKIEANPELAFGQKDIFAAAGKQLHALGLKECAPNS